MGDIKTEYSVLELDVLYELPLTWKASECILEPAFLLEKLISRLLLEPALSPPQAQKAIQLFDLFAACTARDNEPLPLSDVGDHIIDTGTDRPICLRLYRLPKENDVIIKK